MNDARAISAQLVDIRNVGTHKVVKLTIHAPEEHAMQIMELFGWPTGVRPVPVALARLDPLLPHPAVAAPRPALTAPQPQPVGENKQKRSFEDMAPSQQAGMLSQDLAFQRFLAEEYHDQWIGVGWEDGERIAPAIRAGVLVRTLCKVNSRAEIRSDNAEWSALVLAYRLWQRHPELSEA